MIKPNPTKMECPFDYHIQVVNGNQTTVQFVRSGFAYVSGVGTTWAVLTSEQMAIGGIVRNLRDAEGTPLQLVSGIPFDLYVTASSPVLNTEQEVVAWRHTLSQTDSEAFRKQLLALFASAV